MGAVKLSGVIISYNEEDKIERCIQSLLKVCDEVVLLDSFSTDHTCALAEKMGAKVYSHAFDGHIQQKNRAIGYAASPYVLSLDADEALDDELTESIQQVKQNWQYDVYSMNRLNRYAGKWIRHGAWYPDRKLRLWDSRKGSWGGNNPHDKFIPQSGCTRAHLKGNILHYTMESMEDLKRQSARFAEISAKSMYDRKVRSRFILIFLKPLFRFVKDYVLLLGFLDGRAGLDIARMNAWYVWRKYRLLHSMYKAGSTNNTPI